MNGTPEQIAAARRERNRLYKRRSRERLYAQGLTATKQPRTISDEAHAALREGVLRRAAEDRGELVHPRACACYDCLWGESAIAPSLAVGLIHRRSSASIHQSDGASPSVENLVRAMEG